MSPGERVLLGAQLAREDLEAGFTTVRNLGHSGIDGDVALRNAIDRGRVAGPRMLAAGRKITQRGAYVRNLNPALADAIVRQEFLEVGSADDGRVAVEQDFAYRSRSSARSRRMPRRCSAGRTASARSCQGDSRTSSPSPAIRSRTSPSSSACAS
jgi:imidazolonepropionase-like amidohydrolase